MLFRCATSIGTPGRSSSKATGGSGLGSGAFPSSGILGILFQVDQYGFGWKAVPDTASENTLSSCRVQVSVLETPLT